MELRLQRPRKGKENSFCFIIVKSELIQDSVIIIIIMARFYTALFSADSLRSHVILHE